MEVISYSYIYLYSFTLFTINDNCCMKLVNTICFFILLGTLLSCNNEKELYIDSSSKAKNPAYRAVFCQPVFAERYIDY